MTLLCHYSVLLVPRQFLFSLMMLVDNVGSFQTNPAVHCMDTGNKTTLYGPLPISQSVSCVGIKLLVVELAVFQIVNMIGIVSIVKVP